MPKLIVNISGKKGSGKSAAAKLCMAEYINQKIGVSKYAVVKRGKEAFLLDQLENKIINIDKHNEDSKNLIETHRVKIYSFADPLKSICINVLGLDWSQCYGSDDDKNSKTHIEWANMPDYIKEAYAKTKKKTGELKQPGGYLTGREVLEIVGTNVFRRMDETCWARALFNQIKEENYDLAIISDCRFPNEVSIGSEYGAKSLRLLRNPYNSPAASETALDDFPLGNFTLVYDNENNKSMTENHKKLRKHFANWFLSFIPKISE